jgi:hypothetical protein
MRPLGPMTPRVRVSMLALDRALRSPSPNGTRAPVPASLSLALDRAPRSQREITADGHLRIHRTVLTKAEPSAYRGSEIPDWQTFGLDPNRTYWLLRDAEALRKAVKTFEQLPLLILHQPLSSENHPAELVIGATGTDAEFDGISLTNSLVVWSQPAIDAIESGERRDLSCGYRYTPVIAPGIWKGRRIDGYMIDITAQHCALVDQGRVSGAYVADALPSQWRRRRQ